MRRIALIPVVILVLAGCQSVSEPEVDAASQLTVTSAIDVTIDIKPGSDPNSINPKSNGIVPVAILGSADFDVTMVNVTTLAFGPGGAVPAHKDGGHLEDVNDDGFMDLVSHYPTQDAGLTATDTEACVTGATIDGTDAEGCDAVRVLDK